MEMIRLFYDCWPKTKVYSGIEMHTSEAEANGRRGSRAALEEA
jgi:hypothetical protein